MSAYKSDKWETERCVYELLKQTAIFKSWKKYQFNCQTGKCAWCGKPMQYRWTETDHIMPLYYGGTSEASNMVLCHHSCNKNKSTKVGYSRPAWITYNYYDTRLNGKYHALLDEVANGRTPAIRREQQINPAQDNKNGGAQWVKAVIAIAVSLAVLYAIWLFFARLTTNNTPDTPSQNASTSQPTSSQIKNDPDADNKAYAQSILASYTNFYHNYVERSPTIWSLPADTYNCRSASDGCTLSMYAKASLPNGYTYSVNSLDDGVVFSQPGIVPHASKTNVALYKRARCGESGVVIGGSEAKYAAAVIQLSDDSYYCVQN